MDITQINSDAPQSRLTIKCKQGDILEALKEQAQQCDVLAALEKDEMMKRQTEKAQESALQHNLTVRFKQTLSINIIEGKDITPHKRSSRSNCFARVTLEDQRRRTNVQKNTVNPYWNESCLIDFDTTNIHKNIEISVYHLSKLGNATMLGTGQIYCSDLVVGEAKEMWVNLHEKKLFDKHSDKLRERKRDSLEAPKGSVRVKLLLTPPHLDNFLFDIHSSRKDIRIVESNSGSEFILKGKFHALASSFQLYNSQGEHLLDIKKSLMTCIYDFYNPENPNHLLMALIPSNWSNTVKVIREGVRFGKFKNGNLTTRATGEILTKITQKPHHLFQLEICATEDIPLMVASSVLNYIYSKQQ